MMVLVEKDFIDKNTNKFYKKDMIYKTDKKERVIELRENGFLGAELVTKEEPKAPEESLKEEKLKGKKKGDK